MAAVVCVQLQRHVGGKRRRQHHRARSSKTGLGRIRARRGWDKKRRGWWKSSPGSAASNRGEISRLWPLSRRPSPSKLSRSSCKGAGQGVAELQKLPLATVGKIEPRGTPYLLAAPKRRRGKRLMEPHQRQQQHRNFIVAVLLVGYGTHTGRVTEIASWNLGMTVLHIRNAIRHPEETARMIPR